MLATENRADTGPELNACTCRIECGTQNGIWNPPAPLWLILPWMFIIQWQFQYLPFHLQAPFTREERMLRARWQLDHTTNYVLPEI